MLSVAIVGGGMAGLTAAYELQRRGFDTRVLEADRHHLGGRVRTLRFGEFAYAEAGAMRIPAHHAHTREYARLFGLSLRPFKQHDGNGFTRMRGRIWRSGDHVDYGALFDLAAPEIEGSPEQVWSATVGRLVASLTDDEKLDLFRDWPATARVRSLDAYSLLGWLMHEGISAEAIQMLASAWSMETSLHSALTIHLRSQIDETWINAFDEIAGGSDLLPRAVAERLDHPVMQGCEVVKIVQVPGEAYVHYRQGGEEKSLRADFIVCAIPLGPMRRIEFEPPLPPRKCEAVRRLTYDSATKVIGHAARRFWEIDDGIYGGGSSDDEILGSAWYPNDNTDQNEAISHCPGAFIASYSWGQQARRNGGDLDGIRAALAQLHGGLARNPSDLIRLVLWSWDRFRHSEGAYAHFLPGEHASLHAELLQAEGRIHFAGEHTSLDHAWMQGAIASGKRAADEIASA